MKPIYITTLLISFIFSLPLAANDLPPADDEIYFDQLPLVLSASRLIHSKQFSPAAVSIIDHEMIEASGATSIPELLTLIPGMQVGSYYNFQPAVSYHGMGDEYSRNLQVTIDGRSVYQPSVGGIYWADLPVFIADIERIEVIRGPNSVTFGSNAFQGVINIVTRHSYGMQDNEISYATSDGGDLRISRVRLGKQFEDFSVRVSAGKETSNGYRNVNDRFYSNKINTGLHWSFDKNNQFHLSLGYLTSNKNYPQESNVLARKQISRDHFQYLTWTHQNNNNESTLRLSHNFHRIRDDQAKFFIDNPAISLPVDPSTRDQRYDIELQNSTEHSLDLRYVWGLGARSESGGAPFYLGHENYIKSETYRLFGNIEWRPNHKLLINSGLMAEHHTLYDSELSPRLALNYELNPSLILRASISRASRIPALFEQFISTRVVIDTPIGTFENQIHVSTGDIEREVIVSKEIGAIVDLPKWHSQFDIKLFIDHLSKIIDSSKVPFNDIDGTVREYDNRYKVNIRGAEIEWEIKPGHRTRLLINYAYLHLKDNDRWSGGLRESAPRHSANFFAIQHLTDTLTGSLRMHYQSRMEFRSAGNMLPDNGYMTLGLSKTIHWEYHQATVSFFAKNLLEKHPDFLAENRHEPTYLLEFTYR